MVVTTTTTIHDTRSVFAKCQTHFRSLLGQQINAMMIVMTVTMLCAGDGAAHPVPEDPRGRDGGHILPDLQEEDRRKVSEQGTHRLLST